MMVTHTDFKFPEELWPPTSAPFPVIPRVPVRSESIKPFSSSLPEEIQPSFFDSLSFRLMAAEMIFI
jgi:hypothetical protein